MLEEVDQKSYLSILKDADIGLVSLNKKLKSNNFKLIGHIKIHVMNLKMNLAFLK